MKIIHTILSRPALFLGIVIILIFFVAALAAPLLAPPPEGTDNPYLLPRSGFQAYPQPPSEGHPLGLLPRQYDIYYGLIWGTRTALQFGLFITLGRMLVGIPLGLLAGYYGRWTDAVLMRLTDAFMAFPIIAAVMLAVALFGSQVRPPTGPSGGFFMTPSPEQQVVIITLVAFGWMSYARLMRGNVLAEREKEYIQASKSVGVQNRRMIFRHLMPNVTQGLFVLIASDIGAVVVLMAMFTFIGLIPPPWGGIEADWGQMLTVSRDWIIGSPANAFEHWYTYIPVSAAIVLFSIGWNLIGDGLRDVMDPRLRNRRSSPARRT